MDDIVKKYRINKYFDEIENLQDQVDKILHSKNIFVRIFKHSKAIKLHNKAQKMLDNVYDGSLLKED